MTRDNCHEARQYKQLQESTIINYRNALYQGQFDEYNEKRQGRGIIYQSFTHHFIACNNFQSNKITEEAIFYHSHARYHYGRWFNNQPHGVCIFRMNQILIITQYDHGKIKPGTNVLFIFEKFCMGIIIEAEDNDRWSISSKSEVLLNDQMEKLISQCDFTDKKMVSPSLVKFLNNQFPSRLANSFKLRLINNQYYRYGFDRGLSIFFNDQFQIHSVGFHNRNDLSEQIGIKYSSRDLGSIIQQGIFNGVNTFVFEREKKPSLKIGQMYSRHHLTSINFKNQFFIDPSQPYFSFFQKMMGENLFQEMVTQLLQSPRHNSLKDEKPKFKQSQRYQKLDFEQLQVPNFKKGYIETLKSQKMKQAFGEQSSIKLFQKIEELNGLYDTNQFDKLSEKNRLQIMKKQLHNSLSLRQFPAKLSTDRSRRQPQMQEIAQSKRSIREQQENKKNDRHSQENISEDRSQRSKKANLEQKIDIIIRQPPTQDKIHSVSRGKKKIFELSKSVKRGYSPELQVSPFKSKMKARIFDLAHMESQSKSKSKSKNRSSRKIFSKLQKSSYSKSSQRFNGGQQYLSPHLELGLSAEKSNVSSQGANFPVTMAKETKYYHNPKDSEGVEDQGSINVLTVKPSKTTLKENFKMKADDYSQSKKGNQVYRNPIINGRYNQYVYEPIKIKDSGNSPYIKNSSLKSLSKSKSKNQLFENPNNIIQSHKKVIEESSPFKKSKMSGYLNQEKEYRPNVKYSEYKKRTGYF